MAFGCKTSYIPVKSSFDHIKVQANGDTIAPLVTERFLQPYRQKLQDSFSTIIATTTEELTKRRPGGSLGNLVSTAMLDFIENNSPRKSQQPPSQFVIMNYGGIRLNEISAGDITIGTIFELLPFENTLVRMSISGKDLIRLMKQINENGGWPMKYDSTKFQAISNISAYQTYELITNNYIAQGGDNCSFLKTLPQEDTQILLRDIVIDFLKKEKTIQPDNNDYLLK